MCEHQWEPASNTNLTRYRCTECKQLGHYPMYARHGKKPTNWRVRVRPMLCRNCKARATCMVWKSMIEVPSCVACAERTAA